MIKDGRAVLYMTGDNSNATISNWTGQLTFRAGYVRKGRHNFARHVYTAWFCGPDGQQWIAKRYGDNTQIAHCRRLKA